MIKKLKDSILKEALEMKDEIVANRRVLHENPETEFNLTNTVTFVKSRLIEMGYNPQNCGKSGLTALVGADTGKVFLLRGDMDALPIVEETDLEFKSTNEFMHACGHDFHTTMLLAAAKILKNHEKELPGQVKLMFQPAEEILEGAKDMIADGLLENPKVDAGLMIHVAPGVPADNGTVVISQPGITQSSADWFEIKINGQGGHGSMPHNAIDPITAACHVHTALHEIHSRELPADAMVVLTVGEIHGGNTSNVIPESVVMKGTLRTLDLDVREQVKKRMEEITQHVAAAFRCEGECIFTNGCPTLVSDSSVIEPVAKHLADFIGKDKAFNLADMPGMSANMGSEDFAYVSQQVPVLMLGLCAADARVSHPYPVHHPKLVLSEDALPYGAAAYVASAIAWLTENTK